MWTEEDQGELDSMLKRKTDHDAELDRLTAQMCCLVGNGEVYDFSLDPQNIVNNASKIRDLLKPYDLLKACSLKELADLIRQTHKCSSDRLWADNAEAIAKLIEEWK